MSTTAKSHTRRSAPTSLLGEPMSTAEFLSYLATHPATARLGRRLGALVTSDTP